MKIPDHLQIIDYQTVITNYDKLIRAFTYKKGDGYTPEFVAELFARMEKAYPEIRFEVDASGGVYFCLLEDPNYGFSTFSVISEELDYIQQTLGASFTDGPRWKNAVQTILDLAEAKELTLYKAKFLSRLLAAFDSEGESWLFDFVESISHGEYKLRYRLNFPLIFHNQEDW